MTMLPAGSPLSWTLHVSETVTVSSISPETVAIVEREIIDVTTSLDVYKQYLPLGVTVKDRTGQVIFQGSTEILELALGGGGEFWRLEENPVYSCQTKEEYEEGLWDELSGFEMYSELNWWEY